MEMNPFRSLFLSLSRMPPILMLFIILGLAVVVTMYVMGMVNQSQEQLQRERALHEQQQSAKVKVVYSTKNIEEGEIIAQEALEERDVEQSKAPVDAFNSSNAVVGQIAAYPIPAGTIVSNHAIKPMAVQTGFEGKIKEGMRAITFGVDTNSGVAGFIAPGSHVDVVAITGTAADTKAAPVMSDVEVVAVGTTYQKAPGSTTANPAGSVTVSATPEDAVKLIRAVSAAKLYLTLRNDKDHTPVAVVDVKDLFPKSRPTDLGADAVATALPPPNLPPPPLPGAGADAGMGTAPAASDA
jgi:pilus assembly protein CpaB